MHWDVVSDRPLGLLGKGTSDRHLGQVEGQHTVHAGGLLAEEHRSLSADHRLHPVGKTGGQGFSSGAFGPLALYRRKKKRKKGKGKKEKTNNIQSVSGDIAARDPMTEQRSQHTGTGGPRHVRV